MPGAGEETAWVPQKSSTPTSTGFHQIEKWQYFSGEEVQIEKKVKGGLLCWLWEESPLPSTRWLLLGRYSGAACWAEREDLRTPAFWDPVCHRKAQATLSGVAVIQTISCVSLNSSSRCKNKKWKRREAFRMYKGQENLWPTETKGVANGGRAA